MKKTKSLFDQYKKVLRNADIFESANTKVCYTIRKFAVERISLEVSKNKMALEETEKSEFEKVVKQLLTQKKTLGNIKF